MRLFENGRPTRMLYLQWAQQGALQPIPPGAVLLEQDGTATRYFRTLWQVSFPTRQRLPVGPLVDDDGSTADRFWDVFI
jgi:hypothetical protein